MRTIPVYPARPIPPANMAQSLLKGRGSYLCLHRLQQARETGTLPDRFAVRALARVAQIAAQRGQLGCRQQHIVRQLLQKRSPIGLQGLHELRIVQR